MTIRTRLIRLESHNTTGNPIEALTDEQLEVAISVLTASLKLDYPEFCDAIKSAKEIADGDMTSEMDPAVVAELVSSLLAHVNGKTMPI